MPNYTTSYSKNKKPRYRRNPTNQLPGARRRQVRRKDSQYLRHSQGFGRTRAGHGYGSNDRRPYAIIVVGCAFLLFVASIIWYMNRGVDITLNGETASVRIHSSIERVIKDKDLDLKAGNLLAVDDSVLEKGAGTRCTVTLDGKPVDVDKLDEVELEGGEKLEIGDGADIYEDHEVDATVIEPKLIVNGAGPVRYVATWGEAGRTEVWTGKRTGKTVDKGMVKKAVDCVVECTSVSPSKKGAKYVALTFDEAPSQRTEQILSILEEKGVKATFFVSGDKVTSNVAAVRAIASSGNELGSNSYSDTHLPKLGTDELRTQLKQGFNAIEQAGGVPVALLRPPFGEFSKENWAAGMDLVSAVVTWSVDSGDWLLKGADVVVDTVVGAAGNGDIILLTDNDSTCEQTVEALPELIDRLHAEGFEIVTVSDLIKTDKDLRDAIDVSRVTMPKGAALPKAGAKGADEGDFAE